MLILSTRLAPQGEEEGEGEAVLRGAEEAPHQGRLPWRPVAAFATEPGV